MYKLHRCYRFLTYWLLAPLIAWPMIGLALITHRLRNEITQAALVISRVPFHLGERARYLFYRRLLISVGTDVTFRYGAFFQYRKARVGNRVLIGYFNTIGEVDIGDHVLIGGNVNLLSGMEQHGFHDPDRLIWDTPGKGRRVIKIGSDVWIGSNSVIGDDVGNRCVIATGSVVTKPIPDHTLAGGVPAKFIKPI